MIRDIIYILLGYILGSILFARVFGLLLKKEDITKGTKDGNPGTSNAFIKGGFLCGVLTLICDLMKGMLPVYLYLRQPSTAALALVIASPVIGHIFPIFYGFRGGKGIATTFGSLLGLCPDFTPALLLAVFFIFFSVAVKISPHYYRTLVTYLSVELTLFMITDDLCIWVGFTFIFVAVMTRMLFSKEEKSRFEVKLLWMR